MDVFETKINNKNVVVLTGGIASGKSTVSDIFSKLGVPVIDTDEIARELVQPHTKAWFQIVDAFGDKILKANQQLNRKKLRKQVFTDRAAKHELESILHPAILEESLKRIVHINFCYCLFVVPLLVETNFFNNPSRVLVIDVPEELQISRIMQRDSVSRSDALAILKAQATRKERLAIADDVIVNDGDIVSLANQIESIHKVYLETFISTQATNC